MQRNKRRAAGVLFLSVAVVFSICMGLQSSIVSASVPYVNERVSVDSSGNQVTDGYSPSSIEDSISQDGRYVAFISTSHSLVSGDTNGKNDVFVRDRTNNTIVRANVSSSGAQMSAGTIDDAVKISANGRFAVFAVTDSNIVSSDNNSSWDVFVRDLQNNTTEIVSLTNAGALGNGSASGGFDISADGRYVTFLSSATNLVSGDTNGRADVFVRDRKLGTTTLLSKSDSGSLANGSVGVPSISCDGAYVIFNSFADNLVSGDTNGHFDVFLVNRIGGGTIKDITINANASGQFSDVPQISCDGSTILFASGASDLVSGDTNSLDDLFAYSIYDETFERVNVSTAGSQATGGAIQEGPGQYSVSFDGRYTAFTTSASNLVSGDTNAVTDIFIHDHQAGTTERLSMRNSSTQTTALSAEPAMSADGRFVAYVSQDSGLVSSDTNSLEDTFISETGY